jgi:hypothetical protein
MSNVSANTTMIAARLPKPLVVGLKAEARARQMSFTAAVVQAVEQWLGPSLADSEPQSGPTVE